MIAVLLTVFSSISFAATDLFDPTMFQPVCPASDEFYQIMKTTASSLIGSENAQQFGPLIASVLLRVRLELCVFESFLYEAVLPFVRAKGLSWVLPLHETTESFVAGTVFAIASNFILLGSSKIFAVLLIYVDVLFGVPIRIIGFLLDKVSKIGSTNIVTGLAKLFEGTGKVISFTRQTIEKFDTFVGRYLVLSTTMYILFKFAHFKFFNE